MTTATTTLSPLLKQIPFLIIDGLERHRKPHSKRESKQGLVTGVFDVRVYRKPEMVLARLWFRRAPQAQSERQNDVVKR
jgi:hypothetical protein